MKFTEQENERVAALKKQAAELTNMIEDHHLARGSSIKTGLKDSNLNQSQYSGPNDQKISQNSHRDQYINDISDYVQ